MPRTIRSSKLDLISSIEARDLQRSRVFLWVSHAKAIEFILLEVEGDRGTRSDEVLKFAV